MIMKGKLAKLFCLAFLVLSVQGVLAVEKKDIVKCVEYIKFLETCGEKICSEKWHLEANAEENRDVIARCEEEQEKVSRLVKLNVDFVYNNVARDIETVFGKGSTDYSDVQKEALIMFISLLDSEGNVQVGDTYFLYAPLNMLALEAGKNAISESLLKKMMEKVPQEFLEQ